MVLVIRVALLAAAFATTQAIPVIERAAAAAEDAVSAKDAFYAAKDLGTAEAWDAFLKSYPNGFYAELARAHLKKLKPDGTQPSQQEQPYPTESEPEPTQPEEAASEPTGASPVATVSEPTEPEAAASEPTSAPPEATVYVAIDGSDDDGDGSAEKPWATISSAVSKVKDGTLILVRPGLYTGRVSLKAETEFANGITIRSETPYAARLRARDSTVVTCYDGCQGITIEGFDIAHAFPGTDGRVIVFHVDGQGDQQAKRITIRGNIIHDSFNNDILKINNNATQVTVEGNVFYNQSSSDEHLDVNSVTDVTVQDNIFFNDFKGSGREQPEETSSFIVIKDSNGEDDGLVGNDRITVRRNIFANWEGGTGSGFVLVGEDGKPYHEARNVVIENNLLLGNGGQIMRAPFGTKGARDVTFRNNTVAGDMPGRAFAMRLNVEGENPPNENISFYNNIWSDPKGTMGDTGEGTTARFAEVPQGQSKGVILDNNLYWNAGTDIPKSPEDTVNVADDAQQQIADPGLGDPSDLVVPRWDANAKRFADRSATIREAFERLVKMYGTPAAGSAAIDAARADQAPGDDILGNKRPAGAKPDLGAVEVE